MGRWHHWDTHTPKKHATWVPHVLARRWLFWERGVCSTLLGVTWWRPTVWLWVCEFSYRKRGNVCHSQYSDTCHCGLVCEKCVWSVEVAAQICFCMRYVHMKCVRIFLWKTFLYPLTTLISHLSLKRCSCLLSEGLWLPFFLSQITHTNIDQAAYFTLCIYLVTFKV